MSILDARSLKKAFGPQVTCEDVSLTIEEGERVGLVGKNGCGKSTLAKMLAEVEPTDGGTIAKRRNARVGYLAQSPELDLAMSAWDEACRGLSRWNEAKRSYDDATEGLEAGGTNERRTEALLATQSEALAQIEHLGGWEPHHRVRALLEHLGVRDPERALGTMSGGEQRRVALARLLIEEPELAILDEPTNHLDADTIEWLETYLIDTYRGAVLFVTHDRYFLDRIVTRTWELERGALHVYDGGYEEYLIAKAERAEHAAREEQNRQNFLRKELDWLRRTPAARTGKQKARISRAEDAIAVKAPERERKVELSMETSRTGRTIVDLKGLGIDVGVGTDTQRTLIASLDLSLTKGERIGIVGANGSGKTTLLRAVLGQIAPSRGSIVVGQNTKVAYLDQARSGLDPQKSIVDNVAPGQSHVDFAGSRMDIRSYLERFLFDTWQQRQPVGSLSGGERARALVARMLLTPASLLVLDEPTNDLDVATLGSLEEMLVELDGTALVVTHDRWFLDRVATAILAFEGDGRVVKYGGNYSMYRKLKAEAEQRAKEVLGAKRRGNEEKAETAKVVSKPVAVAGEITAAPKKKSSLTYGEKLELESIMEKIDAAEALVASTEAALADPELFSKRGHEVPQRTKDAEAAKRALETVMARWEELESKKG
ncbi:MAG: ABC-F family ATP-binding cassette domain-containing protein [Deltaproteobacteria bacterium]|nr:ABC-F family ATP-binding cassette domain-containing protein [Deltaproteobacteria bacterium]